MLTESVILRAEAEFYEQMEELEKATEVLKKWPILQWKPDTLFTLDAVGFSKTKSIKLSKDEKKALQKNQPT